MNTITVAIFEKTSGASRIIKEFRAIPDLAGKGITDACASYRSNDGSLTLDQMIDRSDRFFIAGLWLGALSGFTIGFYEWGWPISILTAMIGALVGLGFATLFAVLNDYGMNDDFIQKIGSELSPGSSAILIMHQPHMTQKLNAFLIQHGAFVYQTACNDRNQDNLQTVMARRLRSLPDGKPKMYKETI